MSVIGSSALRLTVRREGAIINGDCHLYRIPYKNVTMILSRLGRIKVERIKADISIVDIDLASTRTCIDSDDFKVGELEQKPERLTNSDVAYLVEFLVSILADRGFPDVSKHSGTGAPGASVHWQLLGTALIGKCW